MKILKFLSAIFFSTSILLAQSPTEILRIEAQHYMENGQFGEAIDLLNRYISANPQNPVGYNLRGLCYEKRAQYELSVYDFRSAIKLDSKNSDYHENIKRNTEVWNTQIRNNIIGYNREIALNPNRAVNYLEMGKCYKNLGDWAEAEKWYDEYLKREEASADEIIRYSEIMSKNKHLSKGEPILKKYTEKYPDDHRLWSRYGYFTMWLGKKNTAIKSFETALEIRPYFKEALDGYDLARGKGYVYTVNDTSSRFNYGLPVTQQYTGYPIDRYYSKLKSNPSDDETRVLLINELLKKNRYEEAYDQIEILETSQDGNEEFQILKDEVIFRREEYYSDKISDLKIKVDENHSDRKSLLELAKYYSYNKEYEEAFKLLGMYLVYNPKDNEVRYQYALINSWNKNYEVAKSELEKLLVINPKNVDYNLFNGQLSVWMNNDLEAGEKSLQYVLSKQPNNISALTSLAQLYYQKNMLADSEYYVSKMRNLEPGNPDIIKIQNSIDNQKNLNDEAELYLILESAREEVSKKNCNEAITSFEKYLADEKANKDMRKELADAYLCMKDYNNALKIYDKLISENPNDYDLLKERAKIYLWSGDSKTALIEFQKLTQAKPGDDEVKLFLADSYFAERQYGPAREIYEDLLSASPDSEVLQTRMRWLGSEGTTGFFAGEFPTYMMLTPEVYYFTDNFDFLYSTYGLRYEFGVNNFLSVGISGYGGQLGSDSLTENISMLKGSGYIRFNKFLSASITLGSTMFTNYSNSFLSEIRLVAEDRKKYSFSANYYSMDAAQILYSPFLVPVRLRTNRVLLQGYYIAKNDWKFSGEYSFIDISEDNNGNRLQLRLGKIFEKSFAVGYEYYYYDVKNETTLYWSPSNFETHSIWADWYIADSDLINAVISGKVGYIPSDDFILREFYGIATYRITNHFAFQGRVTFSTNVQSGMGYSSTSFTIAAFWTL
ncbi:MAG TPA: tetratricopeptide repeat protein [Ignavibacteriaceae bacterium]|nr:tetratricopeptide repeat protein [Ignavibacteriaceae bacterium]